LLVGFIIAAALRFSLNFILHFLSLTAQINHTYRFSFRLPPRSLTAACVWGGLYMPYAYIYSPYITSKKKESRKQKKAPGASQ
jgi:hypothetical protein